MVEYCNFGSKRSQNLSETRSSTGFRDLIPGTMTKLIELDKLGIGNTL